MHFNHVRNSMNKYNKKHERSAFAAAAACCLDIKTSDSARVNDETIRRFFFALNVYRKLSLINQRLWGGEKSFANSKQETSTRNRIRCVLFR